MTKIAFKKTLIPNLVIAGVASEMGQEKGKSRPKIVAREDLCITEPLSARTFVMRWNPEISSYKLADFERAMNDFGEGLYFDWSIWEHEKVRIGDRFYMLKVGNGTTGIVMSGTIVSLPYKDFDWSGQGRDVRYVRMIPDMIVHPEKNELVTIEQLDANLPGVSWNEGHSGVLLNDAQKQKIDELWTEFLNNLAVTRK